MFPLERHTIFLTLAGSQAHGTAREGSDVDLRGVCIAPSEVRLSLFRSFEQHEGGLPEALHSQVRPRIEAHPTAARALDVKIECVVFDIAKFLGLCAAANPNALEILFADESDWVLDSPAWRKLHAERHGFLTKKVQQTFLGYALAQLKRIKLHRGWLLTPPAHKPSREEFGLPPSEGTLSVDDQNRLEQSIADKMRSRGIEHVAMDRDTRIAIEAAIDAMLRDVLSTDEEEIEARLRAVATHALGIPRDVVSTLNAEKRYRAAMKHWDAYVSWQRSRNPRRAELERAHGYDTKHAMHLIRLTRMGLEALETGELRVRRSDAAELASIRDGALTYDALLEQAEALQEEMKRAAQHTKLPDDIDRDRVDALAFEVMSDS